jgi:hypothetical protein
MIEKAQADSKHHMDDTKNNRHLHFKGVEKGQFIGCNVPNLSQPKTKKKKRYYSKNSQMGKYGIHLFKKTLVFHYGKF